MKHIKKRFQFEEPLTAERKVSLEKDYPLRSIKELRRSKPKNLKDKEVLLLSERGDGDNKLIKAFHYNRSGSYYFIPEPDPILIYFHNAYVNYKHVREAEQEMFKALNQEILNEGISNLIYRHFSISMGFITSLFTCIEAFLNSMIPDGYEYKEPKRNRTEVYNKDQIQRHLAFETKWTEMIAEITGKDFSKSKPTKWQHLQNLKEFRDMIIHTKMKSGGSTPYDYLFKKSLKFKYEEVLHIARDFINFYKPNYIEECDCGLDF